jgi:hypothetical protein
MNEYKKYKHKERGYVVWAIEKNGYFLVSYPDETEKTLTFAKFYKRFELE